MQYAANKTIQRLAATPVACIVVDNEVYIQAPCPGASHTHALTLRHPTHLLSSGPATYSEPRFRFCVASCQPCSRPIVWGCLCACVFKYIDDKVSFESKFPNSENQNKGLGHQRRT